MLDYIITIFCVREKVYIIKLIRAATGWGLKDSKDFVEKHFVFGDITCKVEFDLVVGVNQYAAVQHLILNSNGTGQPRPRGEIILSKLHPTEDPNPFDLRFA